MQRSQQAGGQAHDSRLRPAGDQAAAAELQEEIERRRTGLGPILDVQPGIDLPQQIFHPFARFQAVVADEGVAEEKHGGPDVAKAGAQRNKQQHTDRQSAKRDPRASGEG